MARPSKVSASGTKAPDLSFQLSLPMWDNEIAVVIELEMDFARHVIAGEAAAHDAHAVAVFIAGHLPGAPIGVLRVVKRGFVFRMRGGRAE